MIAAAAALVLLAGIAIGATSIGGVLVVPALSGFAGMATGQAIAASSFAFLLTGLAGLRRRRGADTGVAARMLPLFGGALAGALAGALLVHWIPSNAIRLWVAALALGSGLYALLAPHRSDGERRDYPSAPWLVVLGVAVGCGSALSGTGGPVILMPIFVLLRLPTAPSVAIAQVVQVPIALAASVVHFVAGRLDLTLGLSVGATLFVGAWAGLWLAHRASVATLRRCTALGLIATAVWYGRI